MTSPLIITCALTGAETTKEQQPNLPVTPKEQAKAAKEAVKAGATIIHLHVREDDGTPSQRLERFEESISAIRTLVPEVLIQISTGGAVGAPFEERIKPLDLRPEMASLNMGTMNFGDDVFYNHPKDIKRLAEVLKDREIVPELEVYDIGMLETSFHYVKRGLVNEPFFLQFVLGVPGGMSGDERNLFHAKALMDSELGPETHWAVAAVGRWQLPVMTQAIKLGGHVRVGFEDNIFLSKGVLAKSNADFVDQAVRIAKEHKRPVATLEQTRKMVVDKQHKYLQ
jgi:3-keto-5-aminohexanoate cleavage enzyme